MLAAPPANLCPPVLDVFWVFHDFVFHKQTDSDTDSGGMGPD